jgi:hypothetical protein
MGEPDKKSLAPPSSTTEGSSKKKWGNRKKYHGNKPTVPTVKFRGSKEELNGHYFDCMGYGQSDRFMKTVQKMADYIGQEYKGGGITHTKVMTQTAVIILAPTRPVSMFLTATDGTITVTPPDVLDISNYQSAKKIVDYKVQYQNVNRQKVFFLVWQQCTKYMHVKIEAHCDYTTTEQALNGIDLLQVIKLICFNIEDEKYVPQKVHDTKAAFYALRQGRDSDQAYQIKFLNTIQVIEQCGASLGEDPLTRLMVCKDLGFQPTMTTATEMAEITKNVRDYTLGTALILGTDPDLYSSMVRDLKNASLAGRDEWPKNVTEAYNYLAKWEGDDTNARGLRNYEGVAFTSNSNTSNKREPQPWHAKMTCRNCDKVGHIAAFCENEKVSSTNVQVAKEYHEEAAQQLLNAVQQEADDEDYYTDLFLLEDQEHRSASFQVKDDVNGGRIPKEWILFDSQSTADAFSNPDLLRDIHEVRGSLTMHTQAGKAITKSRGTVPGYSKVWYCPNGMANILSLAHVAKTQLVKFDSTNGNQFEVTKDDGSVRLSKQSEHGLYYYDMRASERSTLHLIHDPP